MRIILIVCALGWTVAANASWQMAVTVDDLPVHGPLAVGDTRRELARRMIATFKAHGVPDAYGFINASQVKGEDTLRVLKDWAAAGLQLGNHTFTHPHITKLKLEDYLEDIRKNEPMLASLATPEQFKFFRYPFLREGDTKEKREGVRRFLFENGYTIAQVTVNFDDWAWSNPYGRCLAKGDQKALAWLKESFLDHAAKRLTLARQLSQLIYRREIRHVLLLHIGAFTEVMLSDLLELYAKEGAHYVPLKTALADDAYDSDSGYVNENGETLLDQMVVLKKLPYPAVADIPLRELKALCP